MVGIIISMSYTRMQASRCCFESAKLFFAAEGDRGGFLLHFLVPHKIAVVFCECTQADARAEGSDKENWK